MTNDAASQYEFKGKALIGRLLVGRAKALVSPTGTDAGDKRQRASRANLQEKCSSYRFEKCSTKERRRTMTIIEELERKTQELTTARIYCPT
jgi:hypothetical protein